jgi:hypothetical protein
LLDYHQPVHSWDSLSTPAHNPAAPRHASTILACNMELARKVECGRWLITPAGRSATRRLAEDGKRERERERSIARRGWMPKFGESEASKWTGAVVGASTFFVLVLHGKFWQPVGRKECACPLRAGQRAVHGRRRVVLVDGRGRSCRTFFNRARGADGLALAAASAALGAPPP